MPKSLRWIAAAALCACAQAGPPGSSGVGQFVFAGAAPGNTPEITLHWQYGFRFAIDPRTVSQVKLSCGSIPGSAFVVRGYEIAVDDKGIALWRGPDRPVKPESEPWLFDSGTTNETCQAVVSREGFPDALEALSVSIPPAAKQTTLAELRIAHDYNRSQSQLKK